MNEPVDPSSPWLLLVHQLPTNPSRIRVKTWRRLRDVGAVAVKNSVYVLPNTSETREDFEWIRSEILSQGGEATVFAATTIDELSSSEIKDSFERARAADWQALFTTCTELLGAHPAPETLDVEALSAFERQAKGLRTRADQIDKIDFFHGPDRRAALTALDQMTRAITPESDPDVEGAPRRRIAEYQKRVWLTRPRPGVDRMASAWLIQRFVDPHARFEFSERVPQEEETVPFDMYGVELGHHGERVTFETLLHEFGLQDPSLSRLARIVHELDLKAESFSDAEAETVERLVEGLRVSVSDDGLLLNHGIALFEALYCSFSTTRR